MKPWNEIGNLLCVRLDNFGDVLMTTPAIRALRDSLPGCRITLLASAAAGALAGMVPEIDEFIVFAAPWMKATGGQAAQDFAALKEIAAHNFDAAAIFTVYSQSPLPAAYFCHLAGIPLRLAHCHENPYQLLTHWVADPEPLALVRHEVRRQLDLVSTVGCHTDDERLSFRVPAAARAKVAKLLRAFDRSRPLVVVHPGASAASRRYPPESFSRAIDLLARQIECEIAFTGDAAEKELVERVRAGLSVSSHSFAGRLDLGQLGALLAEADLLVSNNTGPAHLAAALGTPVVDLYALTNPQHTPWEVASRVLFHDVPCRNCYKSVCPAGHHDCLRRVAPERVAAAARDLLQLAA
jgi:lipopolysaccharide heptosyltransferase II